MPLLREHLQLLDAADAALRVEDHDADLRHIAEALERCLARVTRGRDENQHLILLARLLERHAHELRQELQRHVLEGTRRAVPELEDALVAHRLDGRALCRIEAAASIGARDAARKLLCRVVRQEEPEHFLGALLIRQGLEPFDEGHVDLWHGIRHEESAVCCQAADDGLRGVELLGISSGAAVFQNNRLFLHL